MIREAGFDAVDFSFCGMHDRAEMLGDGYAECARRTRAVVVGRYLMNKIQSDNGKTVFLMGDSLIEDYGEKRLPLCGWGKYFGQYLKGGTALKNYAHSGWSTKKFLTVGYGNLYPGRSCWDVLIDEIKAGDWLVICLGVNDASLTNDGRTSEEEYRENLTLFTEAVRKKGADVIFGTLHIRGGDDSSERGWDYALAPEGKEEPDMDERWMRRSKVLCEIAADLKVKVFQFGEALKAVYELMYQDYMAEHPDATVAEGRNHVRYYFHLYKKPINTPVEEGGLGYNMPEREDDSTHLNYRGAKVYARVAAEEIAKSDTELAAWITLP